MICTSTALDSCRGNSLPCLLRRRRRGRRYRLFQNCRVRAVGELPEKSSSARFGSHDVIKEKMSVYQEMSIAMPYDSSMPSVMAGPSRNFFGSSSSQFMTATNPPSEIICWRRPRSGIGRPVMNAGFEVRDVHLRQLRPHSVPLHTPQGLKIGSDQLASCWRAVSTSSIHRVALLKLRVGRGLCKSSTPVIAISVSVKSRARWWQMVNEELKKRRHAEPYCLYLSVWEEDRYVVAATGAR